LGNGVEVDLETAL